MNAWEEILGTRSRVPRTAKGADASDYRFGRAFPPVWKSAENVPNVLDFSHTLPYDDGGDGHLRFIKPGTYTAYGLDVQSEQGLLRDGAFWFRLSGIKGIQYLGLSAGNANTAVADVDFAVKVDASGLATAVYQGAAQSGAGSFLGKVTAGATGTRLGLVRKAGEVSIWMEGAKLFTFTQKEQAALSVDTAFSLAKGPTPTDPEPGFQEAKLMPGLGDEDGDLMDDAWERQQIRDLVDADISLFFPGASRPSAASTAG